MNFEENRLTSFSTWPTSGIPAALLAEAGFYYCEEGQRTKCFECNVVIDDWNVSDDALERHRQARPDCPFVVDPQSTANVPLNSTNNNAQELNERDDSNYMQYYGRVSQRLQSFVNWPDSAPVTPEQLANAGFYYLGEADMVECVYCKGVMGKWHPGKDPEQEHRLQFPNCDFYIRRNEEDDSAETSNAKPINGTNGQLERLGIQPHSRPRLSKYATYESRLKTFAEWPKHYNQTPEVLAQAGFYYSGSADCVRCFHCDGALVNWEVNDNAWIEHARWFPSCGFVAMVQGQEFIQACIEKRPPTETLAIFMKQLTSLQNKTNMPSTSTGEPTMSQDRTLNDSELNRLIYLATTSEISDEGTSKLEVDKLQSKNSRQSVLTDNLKAIIRSKLEEMYPHSNLNEIIEIARQISENQNRPEEVESRSLNSLSSDVVPVLNEISNEQEQCNSVVNNDDKERKISHSLEDEQVSHDLMSNGVVTDDETIDNDDKKVINESKSVGRLDDKALLLEEIRRLKEARLCKICMDREVTIVLLPCGHLVTCVFCVPSLTHCPICREDIRAIVRTFLA